MSKNPSFPFYASDYLVDTARWDRGMQGLHVSLMAESWVNGGLKDFDGFPFHAPSAPATDVELWLKIVHKWFKHEGHWYNRRLEEVRAEKRAWIEKQREKGLKSAEARRNKSNQSKPELNHGSTTVKPRRKRGSAPVTPDLNTGSAAVNLEAQPNLTTVQPVLNIGSNLTTVQPELNNSRGVVQPLLNHYEEEKEDEEEVIKNEKEWRYQPLEKSDVFAGIFGDAPKFQELQSMFREQPKEFFLKGFEECWYHFSNSDNPPDNLGGWRTKFAAWLRRKEADELKTKKPKSNAQAANDAKIDGLLSALGNRNSDKIGPVGGQQLRFD